MVFDPVVSVVVLVVVVGGAWYYFVKTPKGQAQWAALKAKFGK